MIDKNSIPAHWEVKKLGEVAKFIDYRGKTPTKTASGVPLITAKNVKKGFINEEPREFIALEDYEGWMTRGIPNKGDVLFTTEAPLGNVAQLKTESRVALAQRIITFQAFSFLNTSFLLYSLMSPQFQKLLNSKGTGTTVKGIKSTVLKQLEISIPPLSEQRETVAKIEELLSELDQGKQQLETARQQLKVYRQAVLKRAFEGRLTNAIENQRKIQDGKLPDGWKWVKIEDIATVGTGATPLKRNKEFYENGNVAWVTSGALNDEFVKEGTDFVTEKALKETNLKVYPKHTLLLAMYGEGKTRGKCSELLIEATTNQAIAAIHFDKHDIRVKPFLKYFLLKNYNDIRRLSSGGVQPNLNLGIVKKTHLPFPPLEEQNQIVQEIESRLSVCDKVEETIIQSLQQAERLRQSILKKAFEGKLLKKVEAV